MDPGGQKHEKDLCGYCGSGNLFSVQFHAARRTHFPGTSAWTRINGGFYCGEPNLFGSCAHRAACNHPPRHVKVLHAVDWRHLREEPDDGCGGTGSTGDGYESDGLCDRQLD